MNFTIYPAIDLHHGQVVRLKYGDLDLKTIFDDDPRAVARRWIAAGSDWLHVVNLDGAFDESGAQNWRVLPDLVKLGAKIQCGGGIRTLKDIARIINLGVSRIIIGTSAVEEPDVVEEAVRRFGSERIAVGIDARDRVVKTRGWTQNSSISPLDLALHMAALGVRHIIYTDISRDGVLTGVNAAGAAELAQETGLNVVASGGVATLDDVRRTLSFHNQGVVGLIIGRALYDGNLDLAEAIRLVKGQ
ncbi:MAG: 1-(5-phosphoribosyl)-5-[(5-phosphoribosylamino)methylideneamino]imidazole-4-carboxamide isomerase [Candidatus Promineifilaceae bacterium]|nr:1-(5-phosphoribosyl)-5-[(5-phosphoribosylamino)methylideneamino]imidazole-4-carboxamide isomerase [Candidatus Promineifilaceae bacterium]